MYKKVAGGFADLTPDRLKKGQQGEYSDFKAGEPNMVYTEEEAKKMKKGKTLLGQGVERKVGL